MRRASRRGLCKRGLLSIAGIAGIPSLSHAVQDATTPYKRPKLKITDVRTGEVRVHGYQVHVRVHTDQGIFGHGETTDAAVGTVPLIRSFSRLLGRDGGVIFIPPQLAEGVVQYPEITRLRDMFGHQRLREGKYTAGQIDTAWSAAIETDFTGWLRENIDKLPVAKEQVEEILKRRQK